MYREFERNASGLLGELYEADQDKSRKLLTRPIETWKKTTVFELADNAGLMNFMKHDCCQTSLDRVWYGKLTPSIAMWQVGVNTFYHFTALIVLSFLSKFNNFV